MKSREELAAVRDRVLREIAANPSRRPYLTELYERPPRPEISDEERMRRRERVRSRQRRYVRRTEPDR